MATSNLLTTDQLIEIIKLQTDIAKVGLDLGRVMDLVVTQTQVLTRADGAVVELAEGDEMIYSAVAGIVAAQLGLRLKRSTSLSGRCVEEGVILRCDDSEVDERVDRNACRRVGLRSMVVAPLKYLDSVVGVIKIVSSKVSVFTETDEQILSLMSELIAASMFHATKLEANELYYRATHDSLTNLANRALFFDRLRQALAQAERHSDCVGILNLDMNGLKLINDQYGHRAGDYAIKEVAARIKSVSRESDTVARLGGDEFGIILSRFDNPQTTELQTRRLINAVSMPFDFEQMSIPLGISVGAAVFPDDGKEIDYLLEQADKSMYAMKRAQKSG